MNIETKWLEDFLSLANSKSFSKAAEERHLTQPGLSRRIQSLEQAIERQLIDRRQSPIRLTAEGELFENTARNLLLQLNSSIRHIRELRYQQAETLEFAVPQTLSLSLFPTLLQSMQQALGQLPVRQLVTNVDDCVSAFQNGLTHFLMAFEDCGIQRPNDLSLFLQDEIMIPVCKPTRSGDPMFELKPSDQPIPFLSYEPNTYLGRRVATMLDKQPKLNLQPVFESAMADSLKSMALQGAGIAWVPEFSIRDELNRNALVTAGSDKWNLTLRVYLYLRKDEPDSLAYKVWEYFHNQCASSSTM